MERLRLAHMVRQEMRAGDLRGSVAQCGALLPVLAAGARPASDSRAGLLHQAGSHNQVIATSVSLHFTSYLLSTSG